MSRNIKWGIKRSFEKGTSGYAEFVCFGYKRGDDGGLVIDEPNAKIVRKMFEMRATGSSLGASSNWLYKSKVPSVEDLFSGKQVKNQGELERFLIQKHHPAIVSRELFETVNQAGGADA